MRWVFVRAIEPNGLPDGRALLAGCRMSTGDATGLEISDIRGKHANRDALSSAWISCSKPEDLTTSGAANILKRSVSSLLVALFSPKYLEFRRSRQGCLPDGLALR